MLALPGQSGSFGFGSRHGPSEGALDRLGAPLPRPVGGIDRGNKTALMSVPRRAIHENPGLLTRRLRRHCIAMDRGQCDSSVDGRLVSSLVVHGRSPSG